MPRDTRFILYGFAADTFSAKGLWLLVQLYFGSLLAAAIISPLAFQAVHSLGAFEGSYVASKPFSEYFDRARYLSVVCIIPFLFIRAKMGSLEKLGLKWADSRVSLKWFLYGVAMVGGLYAVLFFSGIIAPKADLTAALFLRRLASGLAGAILIGVLEEALFRGLVFRLFYTAFRPVTAILLSSFFFAYVHFKMPDELMEGIPIAQIGFDDGLMAAVHTTTAFAQGFNATLFLNLSLVGVLLHLSYLRTSILWSSIGMHAGWVATILTVSKTFNETAQATATSGTERLIDGYWVTALLVVLIAAFGFSAQRNARAAV